MAKVPFIDLINQRARADKKLIVLPESEDERTLRAAEKVMELETADLILLGNPEVIAADAEKYDIDLSGVLVVDPETSERLDYYVETLTELRKAKGMTPELAREALLNDRTTFGVMMVKTGDADGLVSGACHSTANTLRPALQIIKCAPGKKLASAVFMFDIPDCEFGDEGIIACADIALTQDPTPEELAEIGADTAETYEALMGKPARVAFLCHSTKGSAKHAFVTKVQEAVRIAKEQYPNVCLDGELQLDAAIVPEVGESKAPGSPVAGKANVLIFPNLEAGNIGYKLIQRIGKAESYSLIQGLAAPVNDLSRGCYWQDIVGVIAITVLQAQARAKTE
ncbi:MAG: phosphate acetyltransferase [Treponemataceae bacterium]|nr:phosphate acetyltransferase [Treponemataceae bacterium]